MFIWTISDAISIGFWVLVGAGFAIYYIVTGICSAVGRATNRLRSRLGRNAAETAPVGGGFGTRDDGSA